MTFIKSIFIFYFFLIKKKHLTTWLDFLSTLYFMSFGLFFFYSIPFLLVYRPLLEGQVCFIYGTLGWLFSIAEPLTHIKSIQTNKLVNLEWWGAFYTLITMSSRNDENISMNCVMLEPILVRNIVHWCGVWSQNWPVLNLHCQFLSPISSELSHILVPRRSMLVLDYLFYWSISCSNSLLKLILLNEFMMLHWSWQQWVSIMILNFYLYFNHSLLSLFFLKTWLVIILCRLDSNEAVVNVHGSSLKLQATTLAPLKRYMTVI